jgi:hypothetical protein
MKRESFTQTFFEILHLIFDICAQPFKHSLIIRRMTKFSGVVKPSNFVMPRIMPELLRVSSLSVSILVWNLVETMFQMKISTFLFRLDLLLSTFQTRISLLLKLEKQTTLACPTVSMTFEVNYSFVWICHFNVSNKNITVAQTGKTNNSDMSACFYDL